MGMCVRVKRGLVVAGLLLGLVIFGLWTGAAVAAPPDAGPGASSIVVQGNRRIDADTVRSYFKVAPGERLTPAEIDAGLDRKSTRLNSSHSSISYAVFCL